MLDRAGIQHAALVEHGQPIKRRCSLVIVEHDLDFIRDICDRLTVLDQGSVICSGTVQEIQANPKVQEVYLRRA